MPAQLTTQTPDECPFCDGRVDYVGPCFGSGGEQLDGGHCPTCHLYLRRADPGGPWVLLPYGAYDSGNEKGDTTAPTG